MCIVVPDGSPGLFPDSELDVSNSWFIDFDRGRTGRIFWLTKVDSHDHTGLIFNL